MNNRIKIAIVPTVYGIETQPARNTSVLILSIAIVPTVYGIETIRTFYFNATVDILQ